MFARFYHLNCNKSLFYDRFQLIEKKGDSYILKCESCESMIKIEVVE